MTPRLAAHVWVGAYLWRLQALGIPVYVTARGDPDAGAIVVKLALLDGSAQLFQRETDLLTGDLVWRLHSDGPEPQIEATIARARQIDRDLWVIEVEDAKGRHLLDQDGF